jgi:hypothetical protein
MPAIFVRRPWRPKRRRWVPSVAAGDPPLVPTWIWWRLQALSGEQMFKNVASQKVTLFVFDLSNGQPKTGDAANLTFYVSKDDGAATALGDTSAAELDSTNAKGLYTCDLTQAETNADKLVFSGKSSTASVYVVPVTVYTRPPNFTATAITVAGGVTMADGVTHGGTTAKLRLGSSNSTAAFYVTNSGGNAVAFEATGTSGNAVDVRCSHASAVGNAWFCYSASEGVWIESGGSNALELVGAAAGLACYAVLPALFQSAGSNPAITLEQAGGGATGSLSGHVTGNITGNLSGTVGSVTGAVGSVTGAVGSVTGNVGGNVAGTVASVVGNVGGNVVGTVASVVGSVGGNVTGTVGGFTDAAVFDFLDTSWSGHDFTGTGGLGEYVFNVEGYVDDLEGRLTATRAGYLDNLSAGAVATASAVSTVDTNVSTLLTRIPAALFSGITSLAQWLGLIAGKQLGNSTARTELRATGAGSGTFDETTDSAEALRDRGDAAWTTATGFSTLDAAGIRTAVGLASANLDTQLGALPAVKKNTALAGFTFFMADESDHVTGKTGLTITATRSIDGAAFASCANSASEIGNGWYKIDLAAADLNGDTVALRFTGTAADSRNITIVTQG